MSNKAHRTKADELLSYGMPKQQVLDSVLQEFPEAKPKKVAEHLRYSATLRAKERYRILHFTLLGLIVAAALLRILGPMLEGTIRMDMPTAYLSLVPIATLLLGYSIFRWQGQVIEWVGWGNLLGAFGLFNEFSLLVKDGADPWFLFMKVLSVTIGALSLYLARRVFAKPQEVKDPLGQFPTRFVFPDEGVA